ncbi:hypothetical protein E1162_04430 [Rhodobacteraceae bacterium RKSG542]|uniref:hypothetical protein n=1 Tax=Pseudovibrio flavus TaxID=2529854 RepID=UPI0012BCC74A|nr:hypothetical protein [Pseudovibrio flavus]MTI16484.1 hypothetical protein [Pseudovibrio flavus]
MALKSWFPPELHSSYVVTTTFHRSGYELYGSKCIESFLRFWPDDVKMVVYAEDVEVKEQDDRLIVLDQRPTLAALQSFKEAYAGEPKANGTCRAASGEPYNFRWDAVRFSNKVFAITHAIKAWHGRADHLIWLDADTVTRKPVTAELLEKVSPAQNELAAYLNRRSYPECGWVGYNLKHPHILRFAETFEDSYTSGAFMNMKENHDSYVFWQIALEMENADGIPFKKLGSDRARGHIFLNSELGKYLDHLKGPRKNTGRSFVNDVRPWRLDRIWQLLRAR